MSAYAASLTGTGLEVRDIATDAEFASRPPHGRDFSAQLAAMQRVAHAFVEKPNTVLNELCRAAIDLCGADSAGISIEKEGGTEDQFYQWVATAGLYSGFLDAVLPRYPSACGVCLERGAPQLFRVDKRFFDILGVEAPLVTDGVLLPWQVEGIRGTIFIMAHGRDRAFDLEDTRVMKVLADFAATGVRQHRLQVRLLDQASAAAAAAMANDLAHKINNPLQSLTNLLYLAEAGHHGEQARELGHAALEDLQRLSGLVHKLLAIPCRPASNVEIP